MDDQILRIKIVAESNLSQVMNRDEAAVARAQGMLEKLGEEHARHNEMLRKLDEERSRLSEQFFSKRAELIRKDVEEFTKYRANLEKLNRGIADQERRAQDLLLRLDEQKEANARQHLKRILDLKDQAARAETDTQRNKIVRDVAYEQDRFNERKEQIARRTQVVEEGNLSRSKTMHAQLEAEETRHRVAMEAIQSGQVAAAEELVNKKTAIGQKEVAEEQKHNNTIRTLDQQALDQKKRIAGEIEREEQKAGRRSMQQSFGAFGIALAAQTIIRAWEEAGQKVDPTLKVMAAGLGTVSNLMLTGSVISEKYGSKIGGVVGIAIAAVQVLSSLDEEAQQLNATFDQMARKEDTLEYLAALHDLTKEGAQTIMDAAKASGEFAQRMNDVNKAAEPNNRDKLMNWFKDNFGAWATTELRFEGGPHFTMDSYGQRREQANERAKELEREAIAIMRLEQLYNQTLRAAKDYYDASEKGAAAAEAENERFLQTMLELREAQREAGVTRQVASTANYKQYAEDLISAERTLAQRKADIGQRSVELERQWAFERESISRELGQRLAEIEYTRASRVAEINRDLSRTLAQIEYQRVQQLEQIEHTRSTGTASAMRDYFDGEADAAFRHAQQIEDLNFQAMRAEREYQHDLARLQAESAADRARAEREYQYSRARIAREFAYEQLRIERELNQSLAALGFNTGEQMRGAKTERELETLQRRYQFEAAQLRQNAGDARQDLAFRMEEERRALDERRSMDMEEQERRLKMAREELEHRIQMQREELAHRRQQLEEQFAYERGVAARELEQKLADIEARAAYDRQQAEEKAAYDRQQAIEKAAYDKQQATEQAEHQRAQAAQQAADRTRQLEFQVEQQKLAMEQELANAQKRYEEEVKAAEKRYEEEKLMIQNRFDIEMQAIVARRKVESEAHAMRMQEIADEINAYKMVLDEILSYSQPGYHFPNPNIKEDRLPGMDGGPGIGASRGGSTERGATIINIYDARDPEKVGKEVQRVLQRELRR